MKAKVTYKLSSAGQKAALAAGLTATASQEVEIEITNEDLDLFSVSASGSLSASAEQGWVRPWAGATSWDSYSFDAPPSPEELLAFMRQRVQNRARVEAIEAEAKEAKRIEEETRRQAAREAMLARIVLANEQGITDNLTVFHKRALVDNVYTDAVGTNDCFLSVVEYPEAAEFASRVTKQAETQAAKEARIRAIKEAAPHVAQGREVTLQPGGKLLFTCPDSTLKGEWAKHVTSVNKGEKGGYALEGEWLKVNQQFALEAGEVVVVGGKEWQGSKRRGSFIYEAAVYVITTAGVRHLGTWDKTGPAVTKVGELLDMTPEERCRVAIEKAIAAAEKRLAALDALDRTTYAEEYEEEIAPRIAEWSKLKRNCEQVLMGGMGDQKITSVDGAASAIIEEGFRVLTEQYSAEQGGDRDALILIAEAKKLLESFISDSRASA
jgi:hypothetical protein